MSDGSGAALAPDSVVVPLPGLEVVRIAPERAVLRSEAASLVLEGASVPAFLDGILPRLDGRQDVATIAAALGLSAADLGAHLRRLIDAGLLHEQRAGAPAPSALPLGGLLASLGVPPAEGARRLRELVITVFGLEPPGAALARELLACGVGTLRLLDPFAADEAGGHSRAAAAAGRLAPLAAPPQRVEAVAREVNAESVAAMVAESDLAVGAFDRGFSAAHHWINKAALGAGVPALFLAMSGMRATIGPLVIPAETPCLTCWRMRELATAEDFEAAMAYEEQLDRQRRPAQAERPTFPALVPVAAGIAAAEIVKLLLAIGTPQLAGQVASYDALTGELRHHPLLFVPDCPVCAKKNASDRVPPSLSALATDDRPAGDLAAVAGRLVDPRSGVARSVRRLVKDCSEPEWPYVVRAELANSRFLPAGESAFTICSGKGLTLEAARLSALGEAVERYAAGSPAAAALVRGRMTELPGPALDPARLVLFAPWQYADLPYAPFDAAIPHGWMAMRALGADERLFVPALAVHMAYEVPDAREFLFATTSNGLAAGPSLADACLRAALEVIERDAFLATWLHRLPTRRADPMSHPDAGVRSVVAAYGRRGIAVELYRLPTDTSVAVFLGLAVNEGDHDGPAAVVGLGADLDPAAAARGAVLEVGQVRPALRVRLREPATRERMARLVEHPEEVATLDDHDLRYAAPETLGAFGFLRSRPLEPGDWGAPAQPRAADALAKLTAELQALGSDLLVAELTTPDIAGLGLAVARAVIPDFQPIHFGQREPRLGGRRLFELPRRLGLADRVATVAELNPDPHPLA